MAGRPNAPPTSNNYNQDQLLDLGNPGPVYSSGQRPPVDDSQLLQRYNIDDSDEAQPRPSTSYDDFVGGGRAPAPDHAQHPIATGSSRQFNAPFMSDGSRNYSQTSDLHNYSKYGDTDDYVGEESGYKYYDDADTADEHIPGGGVQVMGQHGRNRSSLMSMNGIMDRAKGALGLRDSNYSDMNLPLTESGMQGTRARADTAGTEETRISQEKKGFSFDNVKAMFGRKKIDPASLGPESSISTMPPSTLATNG